MDDKKYVYFVYYTFINDAGPGDGNTAITMGHKIHEIEHIRETENQIKEDRQFNSIVINNYILLNEEGKLNRE